MVTASSATSSQPLAAIANRRELMATGSSLETQRPDRIEARRPPGRQQGEEEVEHHGAGQGGGSFAPCDGGREPGPGAAGETDEQQRVHPPAGCQAEQAARGGEAPRVAEQLRGDLPGGG